MPIIEVLITWSSFIIAVTFHEFSHAYAAHSFGDDTAQRAGRLTLNPLVHIDPIGFLCIVFFGIGWATPVPMNPKKFKYPRLDAVLAAFAGPMANFFLALLSLYCLKYIAQPLQTTAAAPYIITFFRSSIQMNAMLGVFNMLPIPPLDGSHVIAAVLPQRWQATYYRFIPFSIILLLALLMFPGTQRFLINAINNMIEILGCLVI